MCPVLRGARRSTFSVSSATSRRARATAMALMQSVVAKLSQDDMIALASFMASRTP
jgi:cytochrome c553